MCPRIALPSRSSPRLRSRYPDQALAEDRADILSAGRIIDAIGDAGVTVAAYRIGPQAEGGWELAALNHTTGERWSVTGDRALDAATALAEAIGIDLGGITK